MTEEGWGIELESNQSRKGEIHPAKSSFNDYLAGLFATAKKRGQRTLFYPFLCQEKGTAYFILPLSLVGQEKGAKKKGQRTLFYPFLWLKKATIKYAVPFSSLSLGALWRVHRSRDGAGEIPPSSPATALDFHRYIFSDPYVGRPSQAVSASGRASHHIAISSTNPPAARPAPRKARGTIRSPREYSAGLLRGCFPRRYIRAEWERTQCNRLRPKVQTGSSSPCRALAFKQILP